MVKKSNTTEAKVKADNANKSENPVILQVLPELETGGVERGTIEVASYLTEKGWANYVASNGGLMEHELKKLGVPHFKHPLKKKKLGTILANVGKLRKIIKENNVDIVHARSRVPAWSAKWAARKSKVRFLTTFHGTYGLGPFGIKKPYNRVMVQGDLVIAISHFIAEHIVKNYKIPREKIRVVHRGADITKFDPANVSAERIIKLAKEWRVPEDLPIIMLPGRLTRWKGQEKLIEALAKVKNKNFFCLLVGSDQGRIGYRKELENLIIKNNLQGIVNIVDNCSDMPAAYMLSDIVVSAAIEPEAFGRVSVEGQAMGRIVIASNHGGSTETVKDFETGRLYEPSSADALAEAIEWALSLNNEERHKVSLAARDNVRENFTKEQMCRKTLEVYKELMTMPLHSKK